MKGPHPTLPILLLGLTVNMIALPTHAALVCCSAKLTEALRRKETLSDWLQQGVGALFVALGLRVALEKGLKRLRTLERLLAGQRVTRRRLLSTL